MEKANYEKIVNKHKPTETRSQNAFIAFVTGGLIGVIAQLITEVYVVWFDISTKDASSFMLVTLIFVACLFTALGFFDKWVTFCKCGLIIPITGFAHSMMSSGLEYKKEGPIFGLGSNVFKLAGSVITYGVFTSIILSLIYSLFI